MPDCMDRTIPTQVLDRLESLRGQLGSAPGLLCPAGRLSESLACSGLLEGIPLKGVMDGDPALEGLGFHGLKISSYNLPHSETAFVIIASTEHHLQLRSMLRDRLGPKVPLFDLCETEGASEATIPDRIQDVLAARAAAAGLALNPSGAVSVPHDSDSDWIFRPLVQPPDSGMVPLPEGLLPDLKRVRRILWMQPHGLGDLVLSGGALPWLRQRFPEAKIEVLMREQARGILDACPHIDAVISFEAMLAERNGQYLQEILNLLRSRAYDAVFNPLFFRRPLWDLCAVSTAAPVRVALGGGESLQSSSRRELLRSAYTHVVPSNPGIRHALSRTSDFLAGLGLYEKLEPTIWLDPRAEATAISVMHDLGIDASEIVLLFGSAYESWRSYDRFGEALTKALDPKKHVLIACGERRDRGFHQPQLDAYSGRGLNLCGELSLQESLALLARARLMVGVDSGPAHAAAALGVSHIVVMGGGHFGEFFPWHPLTTAVVNPLKCFGCHWNCIYGTRHCLNGIGVDAVAAGVRWALQTGGGRSRVLCAYDGSSTAPCLDLSACVNPARVEVGFQNSNQSPSGEPGS